MRAWDFSPGCAKAHDLCVVGTPPLRTASSNSDILAGIYISNAMPRLYTDIGECIYCGETESPLTREHVLPRGLGGSIAPHGHHEALVLQRASCESCRQITEQIEDECLRSRFWPIRSRLKLNRKDRRPSHVPIHLELADGTTEVRNVEPETAHAAILMTHFDKAEVLDLRQRSQMPRIKAIFPPEFGVPASQHGAVKVGIKGRANNPRFAQMLAKIGLGVVVAESGADGFHPLVRDFIRFLPNDYRHWVGGNGVQNTICLVMLCTVSEPAL